MSGTDTCRRPCDFDNWKPLINQTGRPVRWPAGPDPGGQMKKAAVIINNKDQQYEGLRICVGLLLNGAQVEMYVLQDEIDGQDEAMVIGGADIYALALPIATRLYVTHVHAKPAGDVFFPEFDWCQWQLLEEEHFQSDAKHSADFTIAVYRRKPAG